MSRIEKVENAIKYAEAKIKSAQQGTLYIKKIKDDYRYYVKTDGPEGKETYLSSNDIETVKNLQEKGYYEELKKVAEKELDSLEKIKSIESKIKTIEQVYFDIPESKRNLIRPYMGQEFEAAQKKLQSIIKEWEKAQVSRRGVSKELNLKTLNGERVRSKSELIIADRLKNAGVPYYYEGEYVFSDDELNSKKGAFDSEYDVWFPDFQVLNTRTGELLFWEHFGLMDNPEYCASAQFKIETYAKHGFVIGKNLIVSTESSQHSLNVEYVDKLIEVYLK